MSLELVHASVEKGLRGGSGFGTAVATRGLSVALERALEELSAYDFDPSRAIGADRVDWAHRMVMVQGRSYSVLSRTAPCGSDWSGRANRVAHHLVLEAAERAQAGPAWMLARFRGFALEAPSVGEPAAGPVVPQGALAPRAAHAWSAAGLDAGWAGVVAKTLLDHPGAACYLVLPPDIDALPLLEDVFALLPEDRRWHVTFSTRFLRASASARCQLRCVRANAATLRSLLAEPGVRSIAVDPAVSAGDQPGARAGREGGAIESGLRAPARVQPVLRGAPASHAAAEPRTIASGTLALRSTPGAPDAPTSARGDPWPIESRLRQSAPTLGSDLFAYILFGVAGVALLASFVLALLILFRTSKG
jgi:hypothetical protein